MSSHWPAVVGYLKSKNAHLIAATAALSEIGCNPLSERLQTYYTYLGLLGSLCEALRSEGCEAVQVHVSAHTLQAFYSSISGLKVH